MRQLDLDKLANVSNDLVPLAAWAQIFHGKQDEFVQCIDDNREVAYIGGNGSGKTRVLYWTLVALALGLHPKQFAPPPIRIKCLVTDFEHGLDKIAYDTLFREETLPGGYEMGAMCPVSMIKLSPSGHFWTKDDRTLYFTNGSFMTFMTSEQRRKLHSGTTFDVLACDEEAGEEQYDESKRGLRTAKGGGRIFHALTPPYEEGRGPSWTKFKLLDPWQSGELTDVTVIKAAMADNPAITPKFIEWFGRGKTEEQLRVQLYGEYPTWGVMVHPDFDDTEWNPEDGTGNLLPHDWPIPFDDPSCLFEFAIDWHQSKPAAAVWTVTDNDGNVIVYDELAPQDVTGKTIAELAQIITDQEGMRFDLRQPMRIRRLCDPKMKDKSHAIIRGFNAFQEFRNCGIRLTDGYNRQPEVGISIVNDFIRGDSKTHPRLFVLNHLTNTRNYMKNHYWIKQADGLGKTDGKWSDFPICVRYIVQQKARRAKKGMFRHGKKKWPLTSYGGNPRYGPYMGLDVRESEVQREALLRKSRYVKERKLWY